MVGALVVGAAVVGGAVVVTSSTSSPPDMHPESIVAISIKTTIFEIQVLFIEVIYYISLITY